MKRTILIVAMIMAGIGGAWANEVYIEQVGDSSTITITQDGQNNVIGTALDPAFIGGGSNTVTIDQVGASNQLTMVVNGTATDVTVNTQGSNNTQEITCGTTTSASCGGSTITQSVTGDNNTITQTLNSGQRTSNITVAGDYNTVTHTASGTGAHSADITVTGSGTGLVNNTVAVTQSGANAKTAVVNASGAGIAINITQSD
jgi:hypothetical protein